MSQVIACDSSTPGLTIPRINPMMITAPKWAGDRDVTLDPFDGGMPDGRIRIGE